MICATKRKLCSMRALRASSSPLDIRSRYSASSSRFSGLGKEPLLPDSRRVKNSPFNVSNNHAVHIGMPPPSFIPMRLRPVPMFSSKKSYKHPPICLSEFHAINRPFHILHFPHSLIKHILATRIKRAQTFVCALKHGAVKADLTSA